MNAPRLPAILATLLCMTYPATSAGDEMRGEVSLEATAHEILGDDATTLFGSALDPDEVNEWALYVPESYDPESPAGLLVFISPTDSGRMPGRYRQVLDDNNLIWIGANHSGNRIRVARRISLALLATAIADSSYRIDASRVYVSGFSGGGRAASAVAPEYAQLFTGAIYICGADFWEGRTPKRLDQGLSARRYRQRHAAGGRRHGSPHAAARGSRTGHQVPGSLTRAAPARYCRHARFNSGASNAPLARP
jgi:predicted esterase